MMRPEEGWLYAAAVIDLYGQKVIGLSMGERMTTGLVLKVLDEEYRSSERLEGGETAGPTRPWRFFGAS